MIVWVLTSTLVIAIGAAVIAFVIALLGGGGGGGWASPGRRGRGGYRRWGGGLAAAVVGVVAAVVAGAAAAAASAAAERQDDGESGAHRFVISRCPAGALRRAFDAATLQAIEQAITDTERGHGGEIRFAVEASANPLDVMRGVTPRQQALETFARLGVWDTEANNGVLIYVSWADRDVEIVADRGFNGRVSDAGMGRKCVTAWSNRSHAARRGRPSSRVSRRSVR